MIRFYRGTYLILPVVCILLASTSIAFAQSAAFTVNILNVDNENYPTVKASVSVSDAQGFPITEIDSSSFKISEDNQPVTTFTISPYKNTEQPLAIALVMDTSGSMVGTPLSNSIEAAKNFILMLTPTDQLAIITFSSKPLVIQEITSDKETGNLALDGVKAEGDTALYDAIVEATNTLKNRSERKVIVLLTDGEDSGISQFTFDQSVNEAVRWSIPIYPIGFGGVDKAELERLSILTGGFAQINPDSSTLSSAFQIVLDNLREQYLLEFTSSLAADGMEHELAVTVDYQNGTARADSKFIAIPGSVSLTLLDYPDGKEIAGQVLFRPKVLSPANLARLEILIDDQPLTTILTPPYEYLWDSIAVTPGEHKFEFIATDTAGNSGTLNVTLNVVPPISVSTGISPDQVVNGVFSIAAITKAPAGVAKVEFFVDGTLIDEDANPPYAIDWDTTKLSPGYHQLLVKAYDVNGYSGEEQVQVNVDIQNSSNLIWVALIVALVASAIIIPLATRKNRKQKAIQFDASGKDLLSQINQTAAALIEKDGINPGQRWELFENDVHLGRKKEDNDIPLKGLKASRHHAIISKKPEGYVINSLNPDNPLIINNIQAFGEILLSDGDMIQAGDSAFVFELKPYNG